MAKSTSIDLYKLNPNNPNDMFSKLKNITVGVLALQGDYNAHALKISELGFNTKEVRTSDDLNDIFGLVLPGGESTTLLKLLDQELENKIIQFAKSGLPIFATCAGLIILANSVKNPEQRSLNLIDCSVFRNGFGRQIDSFITNNLSRTDSLTKLINDVLNNHKELQVLNGGLSKAEGVFIRAPRIESFGKSVEVLYNITINGNEEPVMIKQDNILGATFHPELSEGINPEYYIFMEMILNHHNKISN